MNILIERLMGVDKLTDEIVAMDLLISAKSGVHNYAMAITEAASPEVRGVLMKQLEEAIDSYETIASYAMQKGLYHPRDVNRQLQLDLQNMQTAMGLP
jgi:similar to spore coat protein